MDSQRHDHDVGQSSRTSKKRGGRQHEDRKWSTEYKPKWKEDDYVNELRISKRTFLYIVGWVDLYWDKRSPKVDYHVDERVAYSLWKLANGATNVEVEEKFGVRRNNVSERTYEVYQVIENRLKDRYLEWPDTQNQTRIKTEFENAFGIPNILGCLYTRHMRIWNHGNANRFLNPNLTEHLGQQCYSLPFQGLVDSKGWFINVFCDEEVGRASTDEEVLGASSIHEKVNSSGGIIIGGNTYPLEDWLMVPYDIPALQQTDKQWLFDKKLADVRRPAWEEFGHLVGRWSYLTKQIEATRDRIPTIVRACCILHNICKERNDELDPRFATNVFDDPTPSIREPSQSAVEARDMIADSLFDGQGYLCYMLANQLIS